MSPPARTCRPATNSCQDDMRIGWMTGEIRDRPIVIASRPGFGAPSHRTMLPTAAWRAAQRRTIDMRRVTEESRAIRGAVSAADPLFPRTSSEPWLAAGSYSPESRTHCMTPVAPDTPTIQPARTRRPARTSIVAFPCGRSAGAENRRFRSRSLPESASKRRDRSRRASRGAENRRTGN